MSDLVGNPEGPFSCVTAHMIFYQPIRINNEKMIHRYNEMHAETKPLINTLRKLAHAINRDFLSFKN